MRLVELLTETVKIPSNILDKIENAVERWVDDCIALQYDINEDKARSLFIKRIHPVIFNILKPYFDNEKYKLNIYVYFMPSGKATMQVSNRWSKFKMNYKGDEKLTSDLTVFLRPDSIYRMKINRSLLISQISNDLTHEITHLIHSLKSSNKSTAAKSQYRGQERDKSYRASPTEIEAYAQTTATQIYKKAKNQDDPVRYINNIFKYLTLGVSSFGNTQLFPNSDYDAYKKLFQTNNKFDRRIWKSYQKKLIEKLNFYKEEFLRKNQKE